MIPVEIKPDVYWVGAVDWDIRDFHGYSTYKGTTYNAYLILDDKITLVDTVKKEHKDQLVKNVSLIIDPAKIDYLIVNHVELDHSGAMMQVVDLIRPEKIFCSPMGQKNMLAYNFPAGYPYETVKTGQSVSLGKKTVQFIETRMLHWPDSMFSYLPDDRLLISSDAFGQHWATSERFDDQVDAAELMAHAAKYYANILLLYSPLVQKLLGDVQKMGLQIDMIAPDHGLIWRTRPQAILEAYDRWSRQVTAQKAIIVYDTMWHSTEKMAVAIAEGLVQENISTKIFNLHHNHRSEVMTELLDAKAVICGSSTLNNNLLPRMADILTYMKGLKPLNRIGAAFGSYGWSGEAVGQINHYLEEMKFTIADPGIKVNYGPNADDLQACQALGQKIGRMIQEQVK
ncbi:FprA family A-type flavoprotein [Desulfobacca acetoxidans]|uniref:Flavodoxin/nitric oxide synthase n=1 Tax=Desulfobacca acetoxidans (strain ATCC 700848 / DSM 11109 / ASRB2) TaxID=880072 RepID=F2NDD3_DESAR|nr:MBL fold metallo-hydrolase [Desulfobacca acetoxidans]AEB09999.1 flavodoxin/nitric oxide synthase [Desulfobacca acetoxidans DSM 11109]